jgi:hypothetical protein
MDNDRIVQVGLPHPLLNFQEIQTGGRVAKRVTKVCCDRKPDCFGVAFTDVLRHIGLVVHGNGLGSPASMVNPC